MNLTHTSYSAILLYLNNPSAWHSKYVLGIKDMQTTPAALVGTAFHKYLELLYKKFDEQACKTSAIRVITDCMDVDWGKTGSVEKALVDLEKLIGHYWKEFSNGLSFLPKGHDIISEARLENKIPGIKLPLKSFIDLVVEDEQGKIHLIDWKTKRSFSESIPPPYYLQAVVYYLQAKKEYGNRVESMSFVEFKASVNRDGTPQVQALTIYFCNLQTQIKAIKYLINQVVKKMTAKRQVLLPNLRDEWEGEKEFNRFIDNYTKTIC